MYTLVEKHIQEHQRVVAKLAALAPDIAQLASACAQALTDGGRIMLCGNGGSAADAQHIAAELVGRFVGDRRALPAIALTTDTSALTAIGNDYGYDAVFSRQVEALACRGDVLIVISTSGNSANVIQAAQVAAARGVHVFGLLGGDGGKLLALCDRALVVPSVTTARIQECHIMLGHLLCAGIESALGID